MKRTNDYSKFKTLTLNRKLNRKHINKLKDSIMLHGYQDSNPILVNDDYEIIDGQHRFQALKEMGMDIPYEVTTSGYNIIIDLNTTSKNWNIEDFINYYCEKDHNPHYVRLKRVSRDLHTNPTTILTISSGNILSGAITNKIKNGSLQFKIDDELKVSTFYSNFEQVYKALRLKPTARFCSALVDLSTRRNFNWKILIDKCKKYSTIAYNCRTREEFIVMLKDVYNFNTRKEELKI